MVYVISIDQRFNQLLSFLFHNFQMPSIGFFANYTGPWKPGWDWWWWWWWGGWRLPQSFAKVGLLLIENDSEKTKLAKKIQTSSNPRKLLVTLLLSTLCNA